jgi:hypothetical protein
VRRGVAPVLRRLSPWMGIVAVALLVALSVAAALSTPTSQQRPSSLRGTVPERTGPPARASHPPVLAQADLARARGAALRFLGNYLRFAYGRAPVRSVTPVSSPLRRQLLRGGASVTPAERRRHPRVVSLQAGAETGGLARATGLVADGGVTSYIVRFTLRRERSGWVVSAIGG